MLFLWDVHQHVGLESGGTGDCKGNLIFNTLYEGFDSRSTLSASNQMTSCMTVVLMNNDHITGEPQMPRSSFFLLKMDLGTESTRFYFFVF